MLRRWGQEDHEFMVTFGYIVRGSLSYSTVSHIRSKVMAMVSTPWERYMIS